MGSADLQLAMKKAVRQARPLTDSGTKIAPILDQVLASQLLLMLYGRCSVSDLSHVQTILHDASSNCGGHVLVNTWFNQQSQTAAKKTWLMPILIPCEGVAEPRWVDCWVRTRKEVGLAVKGELGCPMQPAPKPSGNLDWSSRPLTCREVSSILKTSLECDDSDLSSHRLKVTTLSWSAKCEVSRQDRLVLGRRSSAVVDSDAIYARDISFGPVRALERVLLMIKNGDFCPDGLRSNFSQTLLSQPCLF